MCVSAQRSPNPVTVVYQHNINMINLEKNRGKDLMYRIDTNHKETNNKTNIYKTKDIRYKVPI